MANIIIEFLSVYLQYFRIAGLVPKLRPLTKILFDTNNLVQESAKILDEFDWSLDALSKTVTYSNGHDNCGLDPLDQLIECAKCLTEDVRRFASFVQVSDGIFSIFMSVGSYI